MFEGRQVFLLTGWRYLSRYKLRTALTLLGVIAGVTTFIFGPTIALSITKSMSDALDDIGGRAQLEVRGPTQGFDAALLDSVRGVAGVSAAAPLLSTGGILVGQTEPLVIFGIDPLVDREVRAYALTGGEFLRGRGEILLTKAYADEKGLQVGQQVSLLSSGGFRFFTLVGTLDAAGIARLNGGDIVVMNIEDAYALSGRRSLSSISIVTQEGESLDALSEKLRAVLPDDVTVETPQTMSAQGQQLQLILGLLMFVNSFMILGLGSTLIYNTMAVAVAQRRTEIGVLRAMGMLRSQVRGMFVLESGMIGLLGSVLGVAAGYALVQVGGDLPVFPKDILSNGFSAPPALAVPVWLAPLAILLGTGLSMLAGYVPSRTASHVDPVEALSPIKAETGFMQINRRTVGIAFALVVLSLVGVLVSGKIGIILLPFACLITMTIAVVMILPTVLLLLGRQVPAWMYRWFALPGMMAAENLTKRPKRITATASLMLIGISAAALVSGSNFGYQGFVDEWNKGENIWDFTVMVPGKSPFKPTISIPADVVNDLAKRPGLAAAVPERITTVQHPGMDVNIRALDIAGFRGQGGRLLWDSGDEATAYTRLQNTDRPAVIVSSALATFYGVKVGDVLALDTPDGSTAFEIVGTTLGVIEPASPNEITVLMDRNVYRQLWNDDRVDRMLVKLEPGRDAQTERRALLTDYAMSGVAVFSTVDIGAAFSSRLTSIAVVSQSLTLLLELILVIGVANTLFILILDRRREIGMLRAVGVLGRQIAFSVVLEVVLMVIIASVLAVPLAYFGNYVQTITIQGIFGIRMTGLSLTEVLVSIALILAAAVAAAYFPARHAARLDVLDALRYE